MVANLLDLSRIRAGAFPLQMEINTAEDLLGAVTAQFAAVPSAQLNTVLHLDQPALVGVFDFVQSLRILSNLVENALRVSPPGAAVELEATRNGAALVFTVRDRGPGVPEAEAKRIFEAFYRPEGSPPDAGRAGLGLAISRNLAELQGGTLTHAPNSCGGSVFTLRLPLAEVELPTSSL
jgi:two-component system sensor histidine kinase KdpD